MQVDLSADDDVALEGRSLPLPGSPVAHALREGRGADEDEAAAPIEADEEEEVVDEEDEYLEDGGEEEDEDDDEDADFDEPAASAAATAGTADELPGIWVLNAWAAALPLLENALPKDSRGSCVLPHRHRMRMVEADDEGAVMRVFNAREVWNTTKVCDRCMEPIQDRVFYHCSKDCDVDFCAACHEELQGVLDDFFAGRGAASAGRGDGGAVPVSPEHAIRRMLWAVHITDSLARQILARSAEGRAEIARLLSFEWPQELFSRLVAAVVDVCNGKMLYNATQGALTTSVKPDGTGFYEQQVRPIYRDKAFWFTIGLLQFLYACNEIPRGRVVDGHVQRGPRIDCQDFILEGINTCNPRVEWEQWLQHPSSQAVDVLHVRRFRVPRSFRSLVAHSNLLPISFRRQCLLVDVWTQMRKDPALAAEGGLQLRLRREPEHLVEGVTKAFGRARSAIKADTAAAAAVATPAAAAATESSSSSPAPAGSGGDGAEGGAAERDAAEAMAVDDEGAGGAGAGAGDGTGRHIIALGDASTRPVPAVPSRRPPRPPEFSRGRLRRPLIVSFEGEAGTGPGVRREFFQVAVRAFLPALFVKSSGGIYWFSEDVPAAPDSYFACGVLLGQAVLHDVLVPSVFPRTLFELLLRDLGSPCASPAASEPAPLVAELAVASPQEADALQKVLDYQGDDIADHFGDLGWERAGGEASQQALSQSTKAALVEAYARWALGPRIADRFGPLSEGFRAVLGSSAMVRHMVDAKQLERIVCGGSVAVDVAAIRRRVALQGWDCDEDKAYLEQFWSILTGLPESSKRRFLVFVTASDREPLRGWDELRITVQKNGTGDDRLPTSYTCFSLLLLPRYSSEEILRQSLLQAVTNSEGFGLN